MRRILIAGAASLLLAAASIVACFGEPTLEAQDGGSQDDAAAARDDGKAPADAATTPGADGATGCEGSACPPEDLLPDAGREIGPIAVDELNVYFAVPGVGTSDNYVYACPKTGCGGPPVLLGAALPVAIVSLGGTVYVADSVTNTIKSSPRNGGGMSTVVALDGGSGVLGVWSDGAKLYFATSGTLESCTPTSCTPTSIVGDTSVFDGVAVSSGTLAWIDRSAKHVYTCTLPSCADKKLLPAGTDGLTLTGNVAVWSNALGSTVLACGVAGCGSSPTVIADLSATNGYASATASDGTKVYFRDETNKVLQRCPIAGCTGAPETLASSTPGRNLVLDGAYLYWGSGPSLRRMRVK